MRMIKSFAAAAALSLALGSAAVAGPEATVTLVTAPSVSIAPVIVVVPAAGSSITVNGTTVNVNNLPPQVRGIVNSIQARLAGGGNINSTQTVSPAVLAFLTAYFV
ncbi:hypothetical protein [Sagittula sp. S175]|uniref:hypothetical protein n=1 Tax=Sagittula sp. S175 TaxID=3415129 RepID=UPI003C7EA78E